MKRVTKFSVLYGSSVLAALLLYLIGLKIFLFPALIFGILACLPFPSIAKSLYSRVIIAVMAFYSLFQISALLQFYAHPSGYKVTAVIVTAVVLAGILSRPRNSPLADGVLSKEDGYALLSTALFVIPLAIFCFGPNGTYRIGTIGGIQAIDGVNHYTAIAEVSRDQGFRYTKSNNYPVGFHLTTGFINDTYSASSEDLSFSQNASVYITQYLILGAILMHGIIYLALSILKRLTQDMLRKHTVGQLSVTLGIAFPVIIFYLIPFIYYGFLSYFYITAAFVFGLLYLTVAKEKLSQTTKTAAYLFISFGASANWPLLVPAFMLIAILVIWPDKFKKDNLWLTKKLSIVLGLLFLHLVPVLVQMQYSNSTTSQSINLGGSLHDFHYGVILIGILMMIFIAVSNILTDETKRFLLNILLPIYILLGGLVCFQYFTVGELRYYAIKTAYLVEIINIIIAIPLIVTLMYRKIAAPIQLLFTVAISTIGILFLCGLTANPLSASRSLFRAYSHEAKPAYFDNDVKIYDKLGHNNKVDGYNSVSLHYNKEVDKIFSHEQISYWANGMSYDASSPSLAAKQCNLNVYTNLLFGTFSMTEQEQLKTIVTKCSNEAARNHKHYYIVTDKDSYERINKEFGTLSKVQIVY